MKKLITACLLLLALAVLLAAPAYAGDVEDPLYTVEDGVLLRYNGSDMDLVIPSRFDGQTITAIGDEAFTCCGLTSVVIPNTVTSIGYNAFAWNELTELVLPDSVTSVGDGAFYECTELASVRLSENLQTIGERAFYYTPITTITIPASVTSIGVRAFYECTSLERFEVSASNGVYKSVDGSLFTKDGKEMISYGSGHTAASYEVPDGVELLHPSTFSYCHALKQVKLPASLKMISNWAFGHTGLTEVRLPSAVEEIEFNAFGACSNLQSAYLPASLKTIGQAVFTECPLRNVYYEGSETQWNAIGIHGDNAELLSAAKHYNVNYNCPHTSLTHHAAKPHTCTEDGNIEYWQCDNCGVRFFDANASTVADDVVIPAAHSYRGSVTLTPNCAEPGTRTYTCTVCSAGTPGHSYDEEIPATGEHHYVNGYCDNLLHDGVTVCGKPEAEVVASGVCGYKSGASESLITIYLYPGQSFNIDNLVADNLSWTLDSDGVLTVSGEGDMCTCLYGTLVNSSGTAYGHTISSPWYSYRRQIKKVVLEEGVTNIGLRCFYDCTGLSSLYLPESLTAIRSEAFTNSALRDVYYSGTEEQWASVTKTGLGTVTVHFPQEEPVEAELDLPVSLTAIEAEAFRGIAANVIRIPASVQHIADDAFDDGATLIVTSGSPAEAWAIAHDFTYVAESS